MAVVSAKMQAGVLHADTQQLVKCRSRASPREARVACALSRRGSTAQHSVSVQAGVWGRHSIRSTSQRLSPVTPRAEGSSEAAGVQVALEEEDDPEATQDLRDVQDIIETMEMLRKKRDMTVQETRLIMMIEDPREAERRRQLGIENESGCSREEIASAFMEVMEDRVPGDRLALRTLAQEMRDWPRLRDEDEQAAADARQRRSLYAEVTDVGLPGGRRPKPPTGDWDAAADAASAEAEKAKEQQKDLGETLPPWVGYSVLYGVSSIPIIIGVLVVIILFVNSLQ